MPTRDFFKAYEAELKAEKLYNSGDYVGAAKSLPAHIAPPAPDKAFHKVHSTPLGRIISTRTPAASCRNPARAGIRVPHHDKPAIRACLEGSRNEDADRYLDWFRTLVPGLPQVLKPNGSLVIDIGGVWKKGKPPDRSLYHFELLVMLCREYGLHLAQEFYWLESGQAPDTRGVGQRPTDTRQGCRQLRMVAVAIRISKGIEPTRSSALQRRHEASSQEWLPPQGAPERA